MEELYKAIEEKIKASGYPRKISGEEVYDDICDQIDGKENGSYVLLSKFDDDVIFEYHITIMDSEFNLGVLTMRTTGFEYGYKLNIIQKRELVYVIIIM